MLEPPWQVVEPGVNPMYGWFVWLFFWSWAIIGLVGGALVAPSLVMFASLSNSPYRDWLIIGVAVLTGFLIQFIGNTGLILAAFVKHKLDNSSWPRLAKDAVLVATLHGAITLPIGGIGYAIYRYLTWVGPGQRSVTIAFVGGLLIKTFLIPLIKGLVTGVLFKRFMSWLRGDKAKPAKGGLLSDDAERPS